MKNNTRRRILFGFLLAGLGIMNYPFVSQQVSRRGESCEIASYGKETEALEENTRREMLRQARAYNETLLPETAGLRDAFSGADSTDEEYESILNVDGSGMMGYLVIPKIDVELPVYHGVSTDVLEQGVGHFYGSSLPTGGSGTHAVLSSHRGLPSRALFTDLDQLEPGDSFFLHVLDETLAYEVDDIRVVEPQETQSLSIVPEKDLVTLVTCTPYGINSHRLLVRGARIPWEAQTGIQEPYMKKGMGQILTWGFALSLIILVVAGIWLLPSRRNDKEDLRRE